MDHDLCTAPLQHKLVRTLTPSTTQIVALTAASLVPAPHACHGCELGISQAQAKLQQHCKVTAQLNSWLAEIMAKL